MDPTSRVVVLIDMDCFYCQVEEKLNPKLKDKPIAVVQYNAWRGGGIIAVNYPARDEGVTRHMRGNEAKKKCPSINLVQVPEVRGKADLTKYRDAGKEVADVLATFTPLLQRASVDEAYLDITELVEKRISTDLNDLKVDNLTNTFIVGSDLNDFLHNINYSQEFSTGNLKLAMGGLITEEIRFEVFKKTGYKCSAGIAHNKILAKLVCSLHKPNKQTILPQDAVEMFFETTSINKIKSLGGKFGQTVASDFQIKFMSELAKIPEKQLMQKYDEKTANWLYNVSRGIDLEPVTTKLISKSIACCKNFPGVTSLKSAESIEHWLCKLSEEMGERLEKDLRENNRKAKQIVISFSQEINKKDVSSSRTHPLSSYDPHKIARIAFDVIRKFCLRSDDTYHVKFLGLSACHFEDVKKVREITTFFQVRQSTSTCQKIGKQDNIQEVECNIVDENCEKKDNEITEKNIYCQLTQELDEDINQLIFYDDSCRLKNDNNILEQLNSSSATDLTENSTSNNICNVNEETQECEKPPSSFFVNYFDNDTVPQSDIVSIEDNSRPDSDHSEGYVDNYVEKEGETCTECQKLIPLDDLMSHQDYHFALKLSRNENSLQNTNTRDNNHQKPDDAVNTSKKRGRPKSIKRKVEGNSTLMIFFKKDEENDPSAVTETCLECNKKIKIEELSSHMDYHTAKKIHLEINAIKSSARSVSPPKKKSSKGKNQTSNRSVISFFRPV
ncbi:DNA polymerase eta [Zophobas morio]|uniref:DNA polymerase eta n=1 Tax=Zophobas morio TaxID=2755281 RepID=UPI0030830925